MLPESRARARHHGRAACALCEDACVMRASVAVTERSIRNLCVKHGIGRRYNALQLAPLAQTLVQLLPQQSAHSLGLFAHPFDACKYKLSGVFESDCLKFDYSKYTRSASKHEDDGRRAPSPCDGAFGSYKHPLRDGHTCNYRKTMARHTLTMYLESRCGMYPKVTFLVSVENEVLSLGVRRGPARMVPTGADLSGLDSDALVAAIQLELDAYERSDAASLSLSESDACAINAHLQSLCSLKAQLTSLDSHLTTEIHFANWLTVEGLDLTPKGPSFEPPLFVLGAISRFANGLRLPVVFDAARIAIATVKPTTVEHLLSSNFTQWSVVPINSGFYYLESEGAPSCKSGGTFRFTKSRFMHLSCTFHSNFSACLMPVYNRTQLKHSSCTPKLIFSACGARLDGNQTECCCRQHARCPLDEFVCTDNVSVKLQCQCSATDKCAASGCEHQLCLTNSEYDFVRSIFRTVERVKRRIRETRQVAEEQWECEVCDLELLNEHIAEQLIDEFRGLESALVDSEQRIDRSMLELCDEVCDLQMSTHLANGTAQHPPYGQLGIRNGVRKVSRLTESGSCALNVPYCRLTYNPRSAQPSNIGLLMENKCTYDHRAYVYGRLTPIAPADGLK